MVPLFQCLYDIKLFCLGQAFFASTPVKIQALMLSEIR